jgi:molecular chaperone GrpE
LAKKSKKQDVTKLATAPEASEEVIEDSAEEVEAEAEIDPLTALKNEVEAMRMEAGKNWDLYLRERADLENARKRNQRDKEDAIRFANDRLLKEMVNSAKLSKTVASKRSTPSEQISTRTYIRPWARSSQKTRHPTPW